MKHRFFGSPIIPRARRPAQPPPSEVGFDVGGETHAIVFSPQGDYLVNGEAEGARVWRVQDGMQMAQMRVGRVECLAISQDGKWIAAGTDERKVLVWSAETYQKVLEHRNRHDVIGLDFSPDSAQLASASRDGTATIWDMVTLKQTQTLRHNGQWVVAVKYAPRGNRIATATPDSVRVWDTVDGSLLLVIPVQVTPEYNTGLLWLNDHLFIVSNGKIKEFETLFGLALSEWPVPDSNCYSCIAIARHPDCIAYSADNAITFWDTSTHARLALILHLRDICSIAPSPDYHFLAVGGKCKKIDLQHLSRIITKSDAVLDTTRRENSPTLHAAPTQSLRDWVSATLACCSWGDVLVEAAKYGLSKVTIYWATCECLEATNHMADALACFHQMMNEFGGQANLHGEQFGWTIGFRQRSSSEREHLGDLAVDAQRYEEAISYYTDALFLDSSARDVLVKRAKVCVAAGSWKQALDSVDEMTTKVTIYMVVCECLETMECLMDAVVCFLGMTSELREDTSPQCDEHQIWVADFKRRSSMKLERLGDVALDSGQYEEAITHYTTALSLGLPFPDDMLKKRTEACMAMGSWKRAVNITDQMTTEASIYVVVCKYLEESDRIAEAVDCFLQMTGESREDSTLDGEHSKWVLESTKRLTKKLVHLGDTAVNAQQYGKAVSHYANALSLTFRSSQDILIIRTREFRDTVPGKWALKHADQVERATMYMAICECLEEMDRPVHAVACFFEMMSELGEDAKLRGNHRKWAIDFRQRSSSKLEHLGDLATDAKHHDEAISHYTDALSLDPSSSRDYLIKRAKACVAAGTWERALDHTNQVTMGVTIHMVVCECLESMGCLMDAVGCFLQMTGELNGDTNLRATEFKQRSSTKLEHLGDAAMDAKHYDVAIAYYAAMLSLDPSSPYDILTKRGKASIAIGSWKQAEYDANQMIALDASSPWGYEMKYTALHKTGDYKNAVKTYEAMLSKMQESPDPDIQRLHDQYINPSSSRATIDKLLQKTTRRLPRELIDTSTGRLHDRGAQESAFKSSLIFHELVSSMTRRIDYTRIKREIGQYFRYVMLSHRWEENEPLYENVVHISVYALNESLTHDKLQTFCKLVRDSGFKWAWSDTVCINKSDHFVLQEALVAMFRWYQGSAMVVVYLRGVHTSSPRGSLVKSVWNTRGWTLQEYVAGKVVHFYTESWTPYLGLKLANHKESPVIIAEMEEATGVSAQQLMALRPGLCNIREKLRLASNRQTTRVEDAAYSLLGIFSVSSVHAIYGEGEAALGRLLSHVLAGSGDVSVLAWTGESGSFNSCLPADIAVFDGPATSHLPPPIPDAEMARTISSSQSSSLDLDAAIKLYDRLNELPAPWFSASRMKLPCIAFELPTPTLYTTTRSNRIYHTYTTAFGRVEIKTRQDLSWMKPLYLVHPWLDAILDREHSASTNDAAPPLSPTDEEGIFDADLDESPLSLSEREQQPLPAPLPVASMDKETRARRLVARLGLPFGALLVTLKSTGRRAMDYKRVAADSLITVRFQNVSLEEILENVRTLDVL